MEIAERGWQGAPSFSTPTTPPCKRDRDLRKNHGKEEARCRDLFYALWVSDLFMKRVEANEDWSLFCPNEAPGMADCWGEEFEALYTRYEREGRFVPFSRLCVERLGLFRGGE